MTKRAEFSKAVKRAARKRSGGYCEARGNLYGLPDGQRCGASLAHGLEFDHETLEANSHDASLENCVCACIPCHRIKTRLHDTPLAAKTLRQQDKHHGIRRTSRPMPGSRKSRFKKRMDGTVVVRQ